MTRLGTPAGRPYIACPNAFSTRGAGPGLAGARRDPAHASESDRHEVLSGDDAPVGTGAGAGALATSSAATPAAPPAAERALPQVTHYPEKRHRFGARGFLVLERKECALRS
jgi:hypothetical protein